MLLNQLPITPHVLSTKQGENSDFEWTKNLTKEWETKSNITNNKQKDSNKTPGDTHVRIRERQLTTLSPTITKH